ncbi:sulfatase family protein [Saccharopolyspora taberi]|uniref:Sulfatase N-terminal domain-containing protein n=1 Tax=Saccharopolyspora taberi TaxID=60895 RepID=A0ABN3VEJ7_9PSEU
MSDGTTGRHAEVSRRGVLKGSAVITTAAALPGVLGSAQAAAAGNRPNVLVIVTDDQPKETDWATKKTRDWLAGRGVEFTQAHSTTPLCAPSRSSIFSGRYAHNHGVRDNGHAYNLDQNTTVQRHLKQAGYRTGLFGKYLNSWQIADNPPHFEEWALLQPGYVDGTYNDNGTVRQIPGYTTDVIAERTLAFLDKSATDDRPWFAYVSPYAPHGPNTPEADYAETPVPEWEGRPSVPEPDRADKPVYVQNAANTPADGQAVRQRQLRTLLSVDDAVKAFHDKLAQLGQLENTLVIYVADNGFHWADHGLLGKAAPYRPAHEIPLYVSWPAGGLGSGASDDRIVGNIDIAPTILHAAGVQPDTPQDGRSLLSDFRRDHILTEWWKAGTNGPKDTWASYVGTDKQYVEYYDLHTDESGQEVGTGRVTFREYYDLAADPYQLTNKLYQATPEDEQRLGIPQLASRLAADRRS